MKRKFLTSLFPVLTTVACAAVIASCGDRKENEFPATEGLEYERTDGAGYCVTGIGSADDSDIVIPDSYCGLPVEKISEEAFSDCEKITSVTIGNNVKYIGERAFSGCGGLTSVTIGLSVKVIGIGLFTPAAVLRKWRYPTALRLSGTARSIIAANLRI